MALPSRLRLAAFGSMRIAHAPPEPAVRAEAGGTSEHVGIAHHALRADGPAHPRWWRRRWEAIAIVAVLLLSATLNLIHLDREGWGNQYYAAAVMSMLQSWHNLFFVSFDPGGFVSVDKPPLGFWIQAASAKLLGFSGVSILLPEALAGVASVAVLYHLVRRAFGPVAGVLAALFLAITPVSVVTSRNNTIDSLLVLAVLLAAWAAFRAAESGSLRWLAASMAIIGLGFAIKMMQAYLVLPGVVLLYLVAAPRPRPIRFAHLAAASAILIAVSLAWPLAVDLTPSSERPYVGSTQDNSALSLALGYNGIQRLLGMRFGAGPFGDARAFRRSFDARNAAGDPASPAAPGEPQSPQTFPLLGGGVPPVGAGPGVAGGPPAGGPQGFGGPPVGGAQGFGGPTGRGAQGFGGPPGGEAPGFGGPGGFGENGAPGPLRLFNQELGGQASWLLPLALVGLLVTGVALWTQRRDLAASRPAHAFLLWGGWLLGSAGFFSVAGFFHHYYLVMLGPPIASLAAAGIVGGWRWYREGGRRSWLLPAALVGTAAVQVSLLIHDPDWAHPLAAAVLGLCLIGAMVLLAVHLRSGLLSAGPRMELGAVLAAGLCITSLLVAPAIWAGIEPIGGQGGGFLPSAGPSGRGPFGGGGPGGPGFAPPGFEGFQSAPDRTGGAPGRTGGATDRDDGRRIAGLAARRGAPFGSGGVPRRPPGSFANQEALITFLQANRGGERFLVATTNANSAAPIILATGQPVMAMGGFTGGDPILTSDEVAEMVKDGEVRFFLLGGPGGFPGGPGREGATAWVTQNCAPVPADRLGDGASAPQRSELYDCDTSS